MLACESESAMASKQRPQSVKFAKRKAAARITAKKKSAPKTTKSER